MYIPTKEQAEYIGQEFGMPAYVTDAAVLRQNAKEMLEAFSDLDLKIYYAMKANFNPHIVKTLKEAGIYGIDAVASNEVKYALELGYKPEEIIFTPSNPGTNVIKRIGEKGVLQNLGSLSELERYCELFPNSRVSIRIAPEVGAGEFEKVKTGGENTKFGLMRSDLEKAEQICKWAGVSIVGIHSHIGSGFYDAGAFRHSVEAVLGVARKFDTVEFVDFGGGFGVQYKPNGTKIDLKKFADAIKELITQFKSETGRQLELRIEPGKYLVSNSTALLAEVTTVKQKGGITFVGLNTGFHHLIRPAMYGAYQHIVNTTRPDAEKKWVQVVGNVCETCDVFSEGIDVADPQEGDLLAILVTGGYGAAMSSNYNMRSMAAEVMVNGAVGACAPNAPVLTEGKDCQSEASAEAGKGGDEIKLTKRRQKLADVTAMFV